MAPDEAIDLLLRMVLDFLLTYGFPNRVTKGYAKAANLKHINPQELLQGRVNLLEWVSANPPPMRQRDEAVDRRNLNVILAAVDAVERGAGEMEVGDNVAAVNLDNEAVAIEGENQEGVAAIINNNQEEEEVHLHGDGGGLNNEQQMGGVDNEQEAGRLRRNRKRKMDPLYYYSF